MRTALLCLACLTLAIGIQALKHEYCAASSAIASPATTAKRPNDNYDLVTRWRTKHCLYRECFCDGWKAAIHVVHHSRRSSERASR
jgi:hypothetical protein